jgi:hypothetical protein
MPIAIRPNFSRMICFLHNTCAADASSLIVLPTRLTRDSSIGSSRPRRHRVVVIVARDVIARILNVDHVDEHLSRARGARAGLFCKCRNGVQTASLKFLRHPGPGITADQGAAHQLWASTQREIRLFNGFTEFWGFREEEGGVVTRNYESSYRRVVQFAVFTSTRN